jgi:uncharacterized membrane protein YcaP (DUF421 family)
MSGDVLQTLWNDLLVPGTSILEKIIRPIAVYIFLVLVLRLGGLREIAQTNTFDLVVLLTLSNAVQNAIIGDDNSLLGGFIGGFTLIATNLLVVRFLYHHPRLDQIVEGRSVLLVKDGRHLHQNLERELITEEELASAVRRQGIQRIQDCAEVILETSGAISVVQREPTRTEIAEKQLGERLDRIERLLEEIRKGK